MKILKCPLCNFRCTYMPFFERHILDFHSLDHQVGLYKEIEENVVEAVVDVGIGVLVESALSSISNTSDNSDFTGAGGSFGGAGSSSDW